MHSHNVFGSFSFSPIKESNRSEMVEDKVNLLFYCNEYDSIRKMIPSSRCKTFHAHCINGCYDELQPYCPNVSLLCRFLCYDVMESILCI